MTVLAILTVLTILAILTVSSVLTVLAIFTVLSMVDGYRFTTVELYCITYNVAGIHDLIDRLDEILIFQGIDQHLDRGDVGVNVIA